MKGQSSLGPTALVLFGLASLGATCEGKKTDRGSDAPDVDLPEVDTRDFTPREKHEFSQYVGALPSPCATLAVSIAECLIEKRPCPACLPAARIVAKAVRDGMTPEQVHNLYKARFDAASVRSIPLEGSPSRGPDAAPVVIVEFADFECPFCQKLAPQLDQMWEAHRDKVRFVYKFFPLSAHPHGEIAARAAIAAQMQSRFWEMHHELFANGQHLEESDLNGYAKKLGLDVDRFRIDMASAAAKARIDADRELADRLGVKGTPSLFIDGREYDPKMDIKGWVESEIAAAADR
jgi:protein-disulfide isomerase